MVIIVHHHLRQQLAIPKLLNNDRFLTSIPPSHHDINTQINQTQQPQNPKETIKPTIIQILRNPTTTLISTTRQLTHHLNQHWAQIIPERRRRQRKRRAQASHGVRSLLVEELQLSNEREDLGAPNYEVLRNLPEHRHGHVLELVVMAVSDHLQPEELESRSGDHSEDGDCETDADALELGEAWLVASYFSGQRDYETVVERDPKDDAEGVEEGERSRGNLEGGGDVEVHGVCLEDEEGSHLAVDGGEYYSGGPYRKQSDYGFELFYLGYCAEVPWIYCPFDLVSLGFHCRSVEEADEKEDNI